MNALLSPSRPDLPTPPSDARVLALLARVAWRRVLNQLSLANTFFTRKQPPEESAGARKATPGKRRSYVWPVLFAMVWANMGFWLGSTLVNRLCDRLSPQPPAEVGQTLADPSALEPQAKAPDADGAVARTDGEPEQSTRRDAPWPQAPHDRDLVAAVGLALSLLILSLLIFQLAGANQDLGKAEWDMEWLFTFPVPARTIFLARTVQSTVVGPMPMIWLALTTYLAVVYSSAGCGWWTLPLALTATVYSALLVASLGLVVEVWVQKKLAPARRKNLQATLALIGGLLYLLCTLANTSEVFAPVLLGVARLLPTAALANPLSLPALLCLHGWPPAAALAAMLLLGVALPLLAVQLADRLVRDGLFATPGAYLGSRGRPAGTRTRGLFRGILGKELRLLGRDRAFLVQTLVLPVMLAGFYFLLHWQQAARLMQEPRHAAALAFGMGAYVLAFSAFHVLTSEANSLWLLLTFPRKLHTILLEKALLWGGFAALYGLAVLGLAGVLGMPLNGEALLAGLTALVGIVVYAFIASAMGVLAANPLETVVQRRVRVEVVYLYLLLASGYAHAVYAPSLWAKVGQVVLSALLALALWQKAQDRMPYLLEPVDVPPPRVSLVGGLVAALAFLVMQDLMFLVLAPSGLRPGIQLLIAVLVAGVVVGLATLFFLRKVPDLLASTGLVRSGTGSRPTLRQAFLPGVLAGGLAALFAVAYLAVVDQISELRALKEAMAAPAQAEAPTLWILALLTVVAAPLFEEFIFRGLIYRGMRRSFRPGLAVLASAAVFALVHPAISVLPVFVLGVAAALSFERSRLLLTPIVTHVVYNAIVMTVNWLR